MNTRKKVYACAALFGLVSSLAVAEEPSRDAGRETPPGAALSEDDCRAIWNLAAGRSDLSPAGAEPYIDSFEAVDTNRDRKISNMEFKAGCKQGLVHKRRAN